MSVFLCFSCGLSAKIIQTSSVIPIEIEFRKADSFTLVFIELDGGILVFSDEILNANNSKFFHKYLLKFQKIGQIKYDPKIGRAVKFASPMRLSEPEWQKMIRFLQIRDVTVCGITKISTKITKDFERIVARLSKNDLRFFNTKILAKIAANSEDFEYKNGIFFCHFNSEFADKIFSSSILRDNFKKVILVTTNRGFLENIQQICAKNGVEFVGFEYTYLKNLPILTKDEAKSQLVKLFGKIRLKNF